MIELVESHGVVVTIGLSLLGFFVSFFVNYLKFMNEFSYIKGQLSQILEIHEEFTDLVAKNVKMEQTINKTIKDLDKAFLRIKVIEHKSMGVSL